MGRSRAVTLPADDDPNQSRSKRKKTGSTAENSQSVYTGQGVIEGKRALYHCNYCNKDISGRIRFKCATCPDFDLCVECFSIGAEVTPHKSNHPYRVMDNLSFPLLCADWNIDEEMLLLEGIGMYGFGNWNEVSEHVGTKSKSLCIDHYNSIYMNSPCFPLPDMSHVMGKSREELLSMAKGQTNIKKEESRSTEHELKEESPFSVTFKVEEARKEILYHQSSSTSTAELGTAMGLNNNNTLLGDKKASMVQSKDEPKSEESPADRRIGEKTIRIAGEERQSMTELRGYNFKRHEFEIEYDNDAEQLLADMEFKDTDTDVEHQLKLRVLHIYLKRLDERKRRKDFVLERNLLYPDPFLKNLSPEERELCQQYKVFMRFLSKEEHEDFLKNVLEDYHISRRISDLQEARAAGCRTATELNSFLDQKIKENAETGPNGKGPHKTNHVKSEIDENEPCTGTEGQAITRTFYDWDVTGVVGAELLCDTEKRLCNELRILPSYYLKMLETLSAELSKGNITKKSDAYGFFKVEPSKVDRVYEMLVLKGIAQA